MRLKQAPAGSVQYIRPCAPPKQGYLVKMHGLKMCDQPISFIHLQNRIISCSSALLPNFTLAISVQYRDLV